MVTGWRRRAWRVDLLAAVAVGGALGSVARYGLDVAWPHPPGMFPWVTLLINLVGCALLGVVMETLATVSAPHRLLRPFLGVGLLGGFTTFSMYSVQTQELLAAGRPAIAVVYVAATLVGALVAVGAGIMVVRTVTRRAP